MYFKISVRKSESIQAKSISLYMIHNEMAHNINPRYFRIRILSVNMP